MPVMACVQACMKMDETLYHVADKIKNFAVMYDDALIFVACVPVRPCTRSHAGAFSRPPLGCARGGNARVSPDRHLTC